MTYLCIIIVCGICRSFESLNIAGGKLFSNICLDLRLENTIELELCWNFLKIISSTFQIVQATMPMFNSMQLSNETRRCLFRLCVTSIDSFGKKFLLLLLLFLFVSFCFWWWWLCGCITCWWCIDWW